jgi:hypothetical protein
MRNSDQIISGFMDSGYDDILIFMLDDIEISTQMALTCLRLHERMDACRAYMRFFSNIDWMKRFLKEISNNTKLQNRWIREINSCSNPDLCFVVNSIRSHFSS